MKNKYVGYNVTRLGYFGKVLATNILSNVAQKFDYFLGYFKTAVAIFRGILLFQNLVTLSGTFMSID